MNKNKQEEKYKELLHIRDRIDELNRQMSKVQPIKLNKKIFAGHWRFLKVRKDILRSSIGIEVQNVVNQCNHWVLGKKKDANSYCCSTEIYYPYGVLSNRNESTWQSGQGLVPLSQDQWDAANFPISYKMRWFTIRKIERNFGTKNITFYKYYPTIPHRMLEFGYKAAYITEVYEPNGDVETELKYLNDKFNELHGWEVLCGRYRDEWNLSFTKKRIIEQIAKKEMYQDLNNQLISYE